MKINLKNESGKNYFSLDTEYLSLYPDELEILLQAGMIATIEKYEQEDQFHIFTLNSSEKLVNK